MKFIVQHNLMNNIQLGQMSCALADLKIPHEFVGVIPFSREITSEEPLVGREYLPYGSTLLTMLTCNNGFDWRGNYFNPVTFDSSMWNYNRNDMLNGGNLRGTTMMISDAIEFLKKQDPKSMWFTRPCEDLKQYSGQVIQADECIKWFNDAMQCESSGSYKLEPTTGVVIAEPRNIQAEWRWFIVDGQVISGSMYRREGQLYKKNESDIATINEAQQLANVWLPHRNCVMDVALVDNEVKVLEFNTINSSGFYDHDIEAIVSALWEDFKRGN